MIGGAREVIRKALRAEIKPRQRLLVAVSGGRDSMALLAALVAVREKLHLALSVAHIDHGLRPTSKADAAFVAAWCADHDVPCVVRRLKKKPARANLESWARSERYQALEELRAQSGSDYIVTAHHANDVAETFLIKIIQHKEPTVLKRRDPERRLIRPFWSLSRAVIDQFISEEAIPFREDESNEDLQFLRNRVRRQLIPMFEELIGPSAAQLLALEAAEVGEDLLVLDAIAAERESIVAANAWGDKRWLAAVRRELSEQPAAITWRMVARLLESKLGFCLGRVPAQRVATFLSGNSAEIELPVGNRLERRGGAIVHRRGATGARKKN